MSPTTTQVVLELERTFSAGRNRVFRAWSQREAVCQWMGPSDELDVTVHAWDFRPGGSYRVEMRSQGGSQHIVAGEFEEIEVPSRLVLTWIWEDQPAMRTRLLVTFEEVEAGTRMVLRHEGIPDEETRAAHESGWIGSFERFDRYLG